MDTFPELLRRKIGKRWQTETKSSNEFISFRNNLIDIRSFQKRSPSKIRLYPQKFQTVSPDKERPNPFGSVITQLRCDPVPYLAIPNAPRIYFLSRLKINLTPKALSV